MEYTDSKQHTDMDTDNVCVDDFHEMGGEGYEATVPAKILKHGSGGPKKALKALSGEEFEYRGVAVETQRKHSGGLDNSNMPVLSALEEHKSPITKENGFSTHAPDFALKSSHLNGA